MKTLLSFLLAMVLVTQGVFAQNATQQQQDVASLSSAATGQSYDLCLKAVIIQDWCLANPQGGVLNGNRYDAAGTAALLNTSNKVLNTQPGGGAPAAATPAPRNSGGLSNRPATPVGRSPNDPQRMAEQDARQGRRQDQQFVAQRAAVEQAIVQAIQFRRLLLITYDNDGGVPSVVEPHLLGVDAAGNWSVQAWAVEGAAQAGMVPGWRYYSLSRISAARATQRTFNGPRPGFDPTGGLIFQRIHSSLTQPGMIQLR